MRTLFSWTLRWSLHPRQGDGAPGRTALCSPTNPLRQEAASLETVAALRPCLHVWQPHCWARTRVSGLPWVPSQCGRGACSPVAGDRSFLLLWPHPGPWKLQAVQKALPSRNESHANCQERVEREAATRFLADGLRSLPLATPTLLMTPPTDTA